MTRPAAGAHTSHDEWEQNNTLRKGGWWQRGGEGTILMRSLKVFPVLVQLESLGSNQHNFAPEHSITPGFNLQHAFGASERSTPFQYVPVDDTTTPFWSNNAANTSTNNLPACCCKMCLMYIAPTRRMYSDCIHLFLCMYKYPGTLPLLCHTGNSSTTTALMKQTTCFYCLRWVKPIITVCPRQ